MAGELQYRTSDGALLYIESGADAGKLAYECCCGGTPSDAPCTDCGSIPTVDAVVTVTGTCGDQSRCDDAAGTYTGANYQNWPTYCSWRFDRVITPSHYASVWIAYNKTTHVWGGYVVADGYSWFGGSMTFGIFAHLLDITGDVACYGSELAGSFSLPGLPVLGSNDDCEGCTANVTIG